MNRLAKAFVFGGICVLFFCLGIFVSKPSSYLKYQPETATIEIYVDGDLAWELEPEDGETYTLLRDLLLKTVTIRPGMPLEKPQIIHVNWT